MINVAVIEDNRVVREVIGDMLNELPDITVVHSAVDLDTSALKQADADVIILDIGLQDSDCLRLAEAVRSDLPGASLIVMDLLPAHEEISQLVNAGVAGFILKDATFDDFVATIRAVAGGERVLPPLMTATLFSQIARVAVERGEDTDAVHMTPREIEVIALIASGMSNKQIAHRMGIASDTVKSHVRNVMEKLALHTRLQIAAYAHQQDE